MRVRMNVGVSGPRHDGRDWPGVGGELEVPDAEGADLCAAGLAAPVAEPEADVETAVVAEPAEQRGAEPAASTPETPDEAPAKRTPGRRASRS